MRPVASLRSRALPARVAPRAFRDSCPDPRLLAHATTRAIILSEGHRNPEDDTVSATTVVNLKGHRDDPGFADVVYVGRAMHRGGWHLPASPLASPFRPGPDGSREDVVARYREYLLGRADLLALLPELRGHRLGCWCAPEPCHAAFIAELADAGA